MIAICDVGSVGGFVGFRWLSIENLKLSGDDLDCCCVGGAKLQAFR